jgi:hypothetical protein
MEFTAYFFRVEDYIKQTKRSKQQAGLYLDGGSKFLRKKNSKLSDYTAS